MGSQSNPAKGGLYYHCLPVWTMANADERLILAFSNYDEVHNFFPLILFIQQQSVSESSTSGWFHYFPVNYVCSPGCDAPLLHRFIGGFAPTHFAEGCFWSRRACCNQVLSVAARWPGILRQGFPPGYHSVTTAPPVWRVEGRPCVNEYEAATRLSNGAVQYVCVCRLFVDE